MSTDKIENIEEVKFSDEELKTIESSLHLANPPAVRLKDGRTRKLIVIHTEPNRKARRLKSNIGKILNNRKITKGRGSNPHRVLSKMAKFHLTIAAKTGRL